MKPFAKTLSIHLLAKLERSNRDASLNYFKSIITRGSELNLIPESVCTNFIEAHKIDNFNNEDSIEENTRTVGINLVVNVTCDEDVDPEYVVRIDSIGSLAITFDRTKVQIEDAVEETNSMLVNEELEDTSDEEETEETDSKEEKKPVEETTPEEEKISAEVIEEKMLVEEEEEGPAWTVTYDLHTMSEALLEDENEEGSSVIIHAPDAETAARLADQHARIKARDDKNWDSAEIVSIRKN